ncbi:hypothetical protein ACWGPO_23260 [Achromobacter animicus]
MEELITWSAIGKVMVAGIGVYIVQPLLLVLRDEVLWRAIDRWLLTAELKVKINQFLEIEENFSTGPIVWEETRSYEDEPTYSIDGKPVSKEDYEHSQYVAKRMGRQLGELRAFIDRRRKRLGWLLMHYKQPSGDNPIDALMEETRRSRKAMLGRIKDIYPGNGE